MSNSENRPKVQRYMEKQKAMNKVYVSFGSYEVLFRQIKEANGIYTPVFEYVPSLSDPDHNFLKDFKFYICQANIVSEERICDYGRSPIWMKVKIYGKKNVNNDHLCAILIEGGRTRLRIWQASLYLEPRAPTEVLKKIDSLCSLVNPEGYDVQSVLQKIE